MRNLTIILTVILLVSCNSKDKINKIPVADLTVAQLSAAFEKDEKAAESIYEGKTIFISGVVTNSAVIRETKGVNLGTYNSGKQWEVLCLIYKSDAPETYSADFKYGEEVKLIGTVDRVKNEKFIHITDCRLAQ